MVPVVYSTPGVTLSTFSRCATAKMRCESFFRAASMARNVAGRPATLRAIEAALKNDSHLIFAVAQRENVDNVTPGVLYTTGTIAKITQIQRGLGGVQLLLLGETRATALHYSENGRYLEAAVREVDDLPPLSAEDAAFVGLHREARERAAELGQKSGLPEEVVRQVLEGVADPGRLADLVDRK